MDFNNEKFPFHQTYHGDEFPRSSFENNNFQRSPYDNFDNAWRQQSLDNRHVIAFVIPMVIVFTVFCICIRCCLACIKKANTPQSAANIIAHSRNHSNNFGSTRNREMQSNWLQIIDERHRDRMAMIHGQRRFPQDSFTHATLVVPSQLETSDSYRGQQRSPSPPPKYSSVVAFDSSLPSYKDCVAV